MRCQAAIGLMQLANYDIFKQTEFVHYVSVTEVAWLVQVWEAF